jgi:hypothetical protein
VFLGGLSNENHVDKVHFSPILKIFSAAFWKRNRVSNHAISQGLVER